MFPPHVLPPALDREPLGSHWLKLAFSLSFSLSSEVLWPFFALQRQNSQFGFRLPDRSRQRPLGLLLRLDSCGNLSLWGSRQGTSVLQCSFKMKVPASNVQSLTLVFQGVCVWVRVGTQELIPPAGMAWGGPRIRFRDSWIYWPMFS